MKLAILLLCVVYSYAAINSVRMMPSFDDCSEDTNYRQLIWLKNTNKFSLSQYKAEGTINNVSLRVWDPLKKLSIKPEYQNLGAISAGSMAPDFTNITGPAGIHVLFFNASFIDEKGESRFMINTFVYNINKKGKTPNDAGYLQNIKFDDPDNSLVSRQTTVNCSGSNPDVAVTSCSFSGDVGIPTWQTLNWKVNTTSMKPNTTFLINSTGVPLGDITINWQKNWQLNNTQPWVASFRISMAGCGTYSINFYIGYYKGPINPPFYVWSGTYNAYGKAQCGCPGGCV